MEEPVTTAIQPTRPQEVSAAIHYAPNGPTLKSCLISILSTHLSKMPSEGSP